MKTDSDKSETVAEAESEATLAAPSGSAITPAIGEACARLLLSDSRLIATVDTYPNGRLILSALYNRYGCRYQENRKACHDLLVAMEHGFWAGKEPETIGLTVTHADMRLLIASLRESDSRRCEELAKDFERLMAVSPNDQAQLPEAE